jgi:hypothetical protein
MKKLLLIALVSATGIVAQAAPTQAPAKNKNVPKSEVADPKTAPSKAPASAPGKSGATPAPNKTVSKSPVNSTPAKPTEKK